MDMESSLALQQRISGYDSIKQSWVSLRKEQCPLKGRTGVQALRKRYKCPNNSYVILWLCKTSSRAIIYNQIQRLSKVLKL